MGGWKHSNPSPIPILTGSALRDKFSYTPSPGMRYLLRRLDNSEFGSSCGNQVHRNMLPRGSYGANACIHERGLGWKWQ